MSYFDSLYQENRQMVFAVSMLYLKNRGDAEDITQDVFLKFLEKSPKFPDDIRAKAWLLRCTKNACISHLRKLSRRQTENKDNMDLYPQLNPGEGALLELLSKVPPLYREALYLRFVCEMPEKEIARILHRKEATLRSQIARGRKLLLSTLTDEKRGGNHE